VAEGIRENEGKGVALLDSPGLTLPLGELEGVAEAESHREGALEGVKEPLLELHWVVQGEALLDSVCDAIPLVVDVSEGEREDDTLWDNVPNPWLPDPVAVPLNPLGEGVREGSGEEEAVLTELTLRVSEMDGVKDGAEELVRPPVTLPLAKDGEEVELRDGLPEALVDAPEEGLLDIVGVMEADLDGELELDVDRDKLPEVDSDAVLLAVALLTLEVIPEAVTEGEMVGLGV